MLNKKAQFYLVSIMIVISIFLGFATVANYSKRTEIFSLNDLSQELKIEKRYLFDYLSMHPSTDEEELSIFTNFSKDYIAKIGEDKDIFFIFGKKPEIKLVGNIKENTNISIDYGNTYFDINDKGYFERTYSSPEEIKIKINNKNEYIFKIEDRQNFDYLINQFNKDETHSISTAEIVNSLEEFSSDGNSEDLTWEEILKPQIDADIAELEILVDAESDTNSKRQVFSPKGVEIIEKYYLENNYRSMAILLILDYESPKYGNFLHVRGPSALLTVVFEKEDGTNRSFESKNSQIYGAYDTGEKFGCLYGNSEDTSAPYHQFQEETNKNIYYCLFDNSDELKKITG
ncbi:MAG TPA: hypothetical protein VJ895_00185 [Candidatus Nanoarchaeia archaeon]|nr:hypothetical protein [Candidatus Nanoarchaeia archaeon]